MPKERPSKPKESQHERLVKLARASGADERESTAVGKMQKIAKPPLKIKGS